MKIVVIGGVAAGMSAASKAKRVRKDAEVTVYEKGEDISYGACGLPYYVSGLNRDHTKMKIRTPQEFEAAGVQTRLGWQALAVDPAAKKVRLRQLATGEEITENYDSLVVATGAEAVRPPLPGAQLPGVYVLKTLQDGLRLQAAAQQVQEIVVIGGGYIGIEVAESLNAAGKMVRVLEAANDILAPFDAELREMLREHLKEKGVQLHLGEPVQAIMEKDGKAAGVQTAKGQYPAQLVVMALGVRPATAFLKPTGIAMAPNGAIEVDRQQRTSLPDVYAAGDCAMVYSRIEQRNVYLALGTVANKCGRIAGGNAAGRQEEFAGCLSSAAIKVGDLEAARTGLSEEMARQMYAEVKSVFVEANDRAQYYPNQTPLWIKLVCDGKTGRILGGQAVGTKGAVLRVDAIAAAITGGLCAKDLGQADFCYAPPFAEAWDALNIAGNAVK